MEEEDHHHQEQELMRHVCKFCNKSFPSGRSLGGHMRSHVTNNNHEAEEKEKLSSSEAGTITNNSSGYGLRENPKKTWRIIADSSTNSEDNNNNNNNNNNSSSFSSLLMCDKLCKECGKGFSSWKALFGHMKRHSHSSSASASDQDSCWTTKKLLVMDSQSDNEATTAAPPRRRTRSKRKTTRRYNIASASTTSFAAKTSCSVYSEAEVEVEIEQEQEEVAMSLMMLSRDVGNWWSARDGGVHSLAESSSVVRTRIQDKKMMKINACSEVGRVGRSAELLDLDLEDDGFEHGKKYSSIKEKISDCSNSNSANKRGKFECTTCKRIFHSYQALGGHRASHKKIKGCFGSNNDNSIQIEIEIETELSPNNKIESLQNEQLGFDDYDDDDDDEAEEEDNKTAKKVNKVHECPICLKVFASGQALGGHKRSHTAKIEEQEEEQVQEIRVRDLLDLNVPAAAATTTEEDETNNSFNADSNNNKRHWWEEAPLLGLISLN
ncbi:zinc finger protein ZAT9-like [Arachis stenosperma]|uniref:zinc finger protein ZAT9-like n=1 Tax=Arachis stenosperma TaxID=217475 RepID=UPI0025ACACD9|nr:zinc finger protein ZAT9-like [Arachis stenosperma]